MIFRLSGLAAKWKLSVVNDSDAIRIEIGDGFHLSRIGREDKAAYLEHLNDAEVTRWTLAIPYPYTEADADWWLEQCAVDAGARLTRFAVREPGGYLIGAIALVDGSVPGAHQAELGYWLARGFWGRGLMPRAINAFADDAFGRLGLHRLYATTFSDNRASQRALEKAGFAREGLLRHHHCKAGAYIDAAIYGRVAEIYAG